MRGESRRPPRAPTLGVVTSDEIRERFLGFFAQRDHRRLPSASLVPASYDPSVLLTTAGMHPLKPYFLGQEAAAAPPPDHVPEVLPHARHRQGGLHHPPPDVLRDAGQLLARRLLQAGRRRARVGAVAGRLRLRSRAASGSPSSRATTSSGSARTRRPSRRGCRSGVPRERIVPCNRDRRTSGRPGRSARAARARSSTWTAGVDFGTPDDLPGGENERFLEYWNLVFMQYDQDPENVLTPLPNQNIDTGLGLNRMALIQQDTPTIFETDQFLPLIRLGEELSGRRYGETVDDRPRAAHPRRPHARHVLPGRRRRRALQRGPRLRAAPPHAPRGAAGAADRRRGRRS